MIARGSLNIYLVNTEKFIIFAAKKHNMHCDSK